MPAIDALTLPFVMPGTSVSAQQAALNSNPYFAYFGVPQTYQPLQSYEGVDQSLKTFPEALKGRSRFLERTFTLMALTQNSFLTSVILPLKYTEETHYTWSQTIFHPYLPERVPHLGVVRYVKNQTNTKTKALTRYGIGLQLEHGFMETAEGRKEYMMEIQQISQSVNENLQAEALYALMNSQTWELQRLRDLQGDSRNTISTTHVDAIIQRELDTWAYMQQNRHAWYGMNDHVARVVETYSQANFSAWIIDIRVDSFRRRVAEDQTTYAIHGPGFLEGLQQGAQHYAVEAGKVIYASRSFLNGDKPVNPLETIAQIGEYFMCADLPDMNFDKYDSSFRTQKFYDEDNDVMKDITLRQKVDHCGRFKADGTLMTFKDLRVNPALDDEEDKRRDFLHYVTPVSDELVPLSLFGQMRHEHFTVTDYRDLARTAFATLGNTSPYKLADYERAFFIIKKYLKTISEVTYDNKFEAWTALLGLWNPLAQAPNSGSNAFPGAEGNGDFQGNNYHSLNIFPDTTADFGPWVDVPPTHGTYGGFKTIQAMYTSQNAAYFRTFSRIAAAEISEAINIFDQFVAKVAAFFPGSLAAAPAWVSSNIHLPSEHDAIFENLLCRQYPSRALFIRPSIGLSNANITGLWRGTGTLDTLNTDTVATRTVASDEFDGLFPSIRAAQTSLFNSVTGDLEVLVPGENARPFIGLRIGSAAAADAVNVQRVPGVALSAKATAISTALAAINSPAAGQSGPYMDKLMLLLMTPGYTLEAAAAKAKILMLLVYVNSNNWNKGGARVIAQRYKDVIDYIESNILRTSVDTVANPQSLYRRIDNLNDTIVEFIARNPDPLVEVAAESANDILTGIDDIVADNNPTRFNARTFNDLTGYRAAPVRIGRAALLAWIDARVAGNSRFMPAGERTPNVPITDGEILKYREPNAYTEDSIRNGAYAQPQYGAGDLRNLPLIVNAKARLSRSIGAPRSKQYSSPEYSTSVRNTSSGMPSLGGETTKRSRYSSSSIDSNIVGGLVTLGNNGTPLPEFHTDNIDDELPESMKQMFRQLCASYDGEIGTQIIAFLFMFTPVTRQAFEATINYDLKHPCNYIIARPHATYRTVASIALKPGAETGNTLIGNIEVTVGDDTTVQTLRAAIRFYQAAIIYEPRNIYVVPNSMVVGYYGGLGSGFIDPSPEKYDPRVGVFGDNPDASVIVIPHPLHAIPTGRALSLSGGLVAVEPTGRVNKLASTPHKYSYETAAFTVRQYRLYNARFNDFEYTVNGPGDLAVVPNSVVFSSLAMYRDPKTGQWSAGTSNCGHWHTETVGPGMHAKRIGRESFPLSSRSLVQTVFSF